VAVTRAVFRSQASDDEKCAHSRFGIWPAFPNPVLQVFGQTFMVKIARDLIEGPATKATDMFGLEAPIFAFSHCRDVVVEATEPAAWRAGTTADDTLERAAVDRRSAVAAHTGWISRHQTRWKRFAPWRDAHLVRPGTCPVRRRPAEDGESAFAGRRITRALSSIALLRPAHGRCEWELIEGARHRRSSEAAIGRLCFDPLLPPQVREASGSAPLSAALITPRTPKGCRHRTSWSAQGHWRRRA